MSLADKIQALLDDISNAEPRQAATRIEALRNFLDDQAEAIVVELRRQNPPKRTREVTVWVNVLKHEGIEWNTVHDSYTVAKYSTTILDPRIEVLAVAVPHTFTIEY